MTLMPKTIRKGTDGPEVWDCQFRLNHVAKATGRLTVFNELKVDGIFGDNTKRRVEEFQSNYRLMSDGIVGRNTWGHLLQMTNGAKAPQYVARPKKPQPAMNPSEAQGQSAFDSAMETFEKAYPHFAKDLQDVVDRDFPTIKPIFAAIGTVDEASKLLLTFKSLREAGFATGPALRLLGEVAAKGGPSQLFRLTSALGVSGGKLARGLKALGPVGIVATVVIGMMDALNYWNKKEYGAFAGELFGIALTLGVPWAALIDAVQTLGEALFPRLSGDPYWAASCRVLKTLNPIGLAKTGVDAYVTCYGVFIDLFMRRKINMQELEKLTKRMKAGPAGFLTEMGEVGGDFFAANFGDLFYEHVLKNTDFFD